MHLKIFADGASWGNPGPAAIGVVIENENGTSLLRISRYIGNATNNQAEYKAVIAALQAARDFKAEKITLYLDSELVARQLDNRYRVKSPVLYPLHKKASELSAKFPTLQIVNIKSAENHAAHQLAKMALERATRSSTVRRK